jgi:hypothetical protein
MQIASYSLKTSVHNHATVRILIADPPHILDQKERSGHVPEKFPLAVNKCCGVREYPIILFTALCISSLICSVKKSLGKL